MFKAIAMMKNALAKSAVVEEQPVTLADKLILSYHLDEARDVHVFCTSCALPTENRAFQASLLEAVVKCGVHAYVLDAVRAAFEIAEYKPQPALNDLLSPRLPCSDNELEITLCKFVVCGKTKEDHKFMLLLGDIVFKEQLDAMEAPAATERFLKKISVSELLEKASDSEDRPRSLLEVLWNSLANSFGTDHDCAMSGVRAEGLRFERMMASARILSLLLHDQHTKLEVIVHWDTRHRYAVNASIHDLEDGTLLFHAQGLACNQIFISQQ